EVQSDPDRQGTPGVAGVGDQGHGRCQEIDARPHSAQGRCRDEGPAWTDDRIAEAVAVHRRTVEHVRQRFVEQGLEAALVRKKQDRPSRERKLDGAGEARLITLACSKPPLGRAAWTLRLLADRLVELQIVASISTETVRQVLKKT